MHRVQDLFGEVLGFDEGDQAELGLALGAENFDPECTAQKLGPRNVPRWVLGLVLFVCQLMADLLADGTRPAVLSRRQ
jgi:hypothetical protein